MDTSIDYMKMIEKSGISKLYNVGDYIFQKSPNNNILWDAYTEIVHDLKDEYELALIANPGWFEYDLSTFTVLLRQDQLQDMIIDKFKEHWGKSVILGTMEEVVGWGHQFPYASMEQLWLAFVMHEKHGKRWDGSDWVVE